MPNWLGPLLVLCGLAGFIVFAFRQGTKVDKENSSNFDSGASPDGSHHGSDSGGH